MIKNFFLISANILLVACVSMKAVHADRVQKQTVQQVSQHIKPCRVQGKTMFLTGDIDPSMLDCVKSLANTHPHGFKTVRLDSPGGNVEAALDIAEILADYHADMIVKHDCSSSCANYFLPVAKSIRLEEGAGILLHGTIDDGLVEIWKQDKSETFKNTSNKYENHIQLVEKSLAFLNRHHIHRGWWLWRTHQDRLNNNFGRYVKGKPQDWPNLMCYFRHCVRSYILAEESFLKSCLKGVQIYPFNNTAVQRMYTDKKFRKRMTRQGVYPSGTMRCTPPSFKRT